MSEKIVIKIDEELKDIVPGFLEKRIKDMPSMWTALEKMDFDTLKTIGHRLKGNAGGYGFDHLGSLGAIIETAAKERDGAKIKSTLKEIENYLGKLDVVYEKLAA